MIQRSWALLLSATLLASGCAADPDEVVDANDPLITDRGVTPTPEAGPDVTLEDSAVDATPVADAFIIDAAPPPACADGVDNDDDGLIDFPDDLGCEDEDDEDESGPPPPQCTDGIDNDGDERVDMEDPDCVNSLDGLEDGVDPETACANGFDDDADGYADFPLDPGCTAAGDNDETDPAVARACSNGADDDEDGLIDYPDDPGCSGRGDPDEADPDPLPLCANGVDDDGDSLTDYPSDPGCHGAGDWTEGSHCPGAEGIIDLNLAGGDYAGALSAESQHIGSCGGGAGGEAILLWRVEAPISELAFSTEHPETDKPTVIYVRRACEMLDDLACNRGTSGAPGTHVVLENPDPGLYYIFVDTSSRELGPGAFRITAGELPAPACRDEEDNDEDGLIDLMDPGCASLDDPDEADPDPLPECGDGIDNDGDGRTDYPADPQCEAAGGVQEARLCDMPLPVDPIEIGQAGGDALLRLMGDGSLAAGSCGGDEGVEEVVVLTLEHPSDMILDITTPGGDAAPVAVHIRSVCEDAETEQFCEVGPTRLTGDALAAGRYFFFFDYVGAGSAPTSVQARFSITSLVTECNDEVDNDEDGFIDLMDPGCEGGRDVSELDVGADFPCADGLDNDEDGLIDYPQDDGCAAAGDDSEDFACELLEDIPRLEGAGSIQVDVQDNTYGGPCDSGDDSAEAVVELRLAIPMAVELETTVGSFDTKLSIRQVCDDDASEFGCDDDGGSGTLSLLSFDRLEAGSYFVFVEAYSSSSRGPVTLEVRTEPIPLFECEDGADNDGDGLIDEADPGCPLSYDDDEQDPDPLPECADGVDNDDDGDVDWPQDLGCGAAGSSREDPLCLELEAMELPPGDASIDFNLNQGLLSTTGGSCDSGEGPEAVFVMDLPTLSRVRLAVDEDSVMFVRTACDDSETEVACTQQEDVTLDMVPAGRYFLFVKNDWGDPPTHLDVEITSLETECNDGVDNDGDGLVDLFDPGCSEPLNEGELDPPTPPECADGIDNDGNGSMDYPEDLGCSAAGDADESLSCEQRDVVEIIEQESAEVDVNLSGENLYSCDGAGGSNGAEAIVALALTLPSEVRLETTEGPDTTLHIRAACDDPDSELGCNDDGGSSTLSLLTFPRLEPGVYFIFVDAYSSSHTGAVTLDVDVTPLVEPDPACADGRDNDGDGLVDMEDPGCANPEDNNEYNAPPPQCSDELDNDEDGLIDMADPGCDAADDDDETDPPPPPQCSDTLDNDEDGYIDLDDPGCENAEDDDEADPPAPQCSDTLDNDEDGYIDLDDPGCESAEDDDETDPPAPQCSDTLDNDEDGYIDLDDPGCESADDDDETNPPPPQCADELDNDEDGLIDLDDPGCEDAADDDETDPPPPQCADELDNDEDGLIDLADPGCVDAEDDDEIDPPTPACADGEDNDEDALIDEADPGCVDAEDDDEADPAGEPPACADGVDNDGDGLTDAADPACPYAGIDDESQACAEIPAAPLPFETPTRFTPQTLALTSTCGEAAPRALAHLIIPPEVEGETLRVQATEAHQWTAPPQIEARLFCDAEAPCDAAMPDAAAGERFILITPTGDPMAESLGGPIEHALLDAEGAPYAPPHDIVETPEGPAWAFGDALMGPIWLEDGAGERVALPFETADPLLGDAPVHVTGDFPADAIWRSRVEGLEGAVLTTWMSRAGEAPTTPTQGTIEAFEGLEASYIAFSVEGSPTALMLLLPDRPMAVEPLVEARAAGLSATLARGATVYMIFGLQTPAEMAEALMSDVEAGRIGVEVITEVQP